MKNDLTVYGLLDIPLPPQCIRLLQLFVDSYPRALHRDFIINNLWTAYNEPTQPLIALRTQVSRLRAELMRYGYTITTAQSTSAYRLQERNKT